jgi:hypothetical protein
MFFTDTVTCEGCGAEITHLCYGTFDTKDPDYHLCDSCIEEREEHSGTGHEDDEEGQLV